MVLKSLSIFSLALAALASSETLTDRMDDMREKILSKHGVEVGGGVQSEYFNSQLGGSARDATRYGYETTQFTSVDLDMHYRPFDYVGAHAILRFHQDWQTFFATRSRIVGARWLSMDGNIDKMLNFNAGDFRQKYTPLTLWSPELDLMYEPAIFSEARTRLMDEQFLGENKRVLQGANLNFAKRLNSPLTEIRADAIGSRIRRAEFLDRDGAQGLLESQDRNGDGSLDTVSLATADMDRYFLAGNAEGLLWDNIVLGATYEALLDDRESFQPVVYGQGTRDQIIAAGSLGLGNSFLDGLSLNERRSVIARDLRVTAAHAAADVSGFIGNPDFTLELLGEYAASSESNKTAWHFRRDSTSQLIVENDPSLAGVDGKAMNLKLNTGYAAGGSYGVKLEADYLNNGANFQNPLAQSPTFMGTRIMNTENDLGGGALYSTFDALNNGVYKFTPSSKTAYYQLSPFSKTSYHNQTLSSQELDGFTGDPVVQLLLPMGLATPNRQGFQSKLSAEWKKAVNAAVAFAQMKQLQGVQVDSAVAGPLTYTQIGGGLKADLDKFSEAAPRVGISGSYVQTKSKRDALPKESAQPGVSVDLIQIGLDYHFLRKWGILGGYQRAVLTSPLTLVQANVANQFDFKETQGNLRMGVEYGLGKNAYFLLSGGLLQVDRTQTHRGTSAGAAANPALNAKSDFSQTFSQALIKVRF